MVGSCLSPEMFIAVFIIANGVKHVECLTVSVGSISRGVATWQDGAASGETPGRLGETPGRWRRRGVSLVLSLSLWILETQFRSDARFTRSRRDMHGELLRGLVIVISHLHTPHAYFVCLNSP